MKRVSIVLILLAGTILAAGCHQKENSDSDGVRAGILQHLSSVSTLNPSAMDMKITNIDVTGDKAQAVAEFSPKTGAVPGAIMRVSYSLEKRAGQWVVVKTNAGGGSMNHPVPGGYPHAQQGQGDVQGNLPNFRDILPPSASDTQGTLPPGHPPVSSTQDKKQN